MNEEELRRALRTGAGGAEPAPGTWDAIVRESGRRGKRGRAARRVRFVAAAAAVLTVGIASVNAITGTESDDGTREIITGVPAVTGGSADLIVESSTFTEEGARASVPDSLADTIAGVEGVDRVTGVVRAVARLTPAATPVPAVVVSWDGGDGFVSSGGRAPEADDEIVLSDAAAASTGLSVGDRLPTDAGEFSIVGRFRLANGETDAVLAGTTLQTARRLSKQGGFTRLHVSLTEGAGATVHEAITSALPAGYRVVGVSQLGTLEQLRDELAIQQAYFDMLHPDGAVRARATDGGVDDDESRRNYDRYRESAAQATFRIQRLSFLDRDHAELVYVIYYGQSRSPVIPEPQAGAAVRIDGRWKITKETSCAIAALGDGRCLLGASAVRPPAGWDPSSSQPDLAAAITNLADPAATVAQRAAAVVDGETRLDVIEAGLRHDGAYVGAVRFYISGVRLRGADQAQVLYSLTADGPQPFETPWPLTVSAVRTDGTWRIDGAYACGLRALAGQAC
jgi:hypothetical protein